MGKGCMEQFGGSGVGVRWFCDVLMLSRGRM